MVMGICPECNTYKNLTEHHSPSKGILPADKTIRDAAIDTFLCRDCHDKKGINSVEISAVRVVKIQGPFTSSVNDLNSLKQDLSKGKIPEFNSEDSYVIAAGSICAGSIFPISGSNLRLHSRNYYQKDDWNRDQYGWGINVNSIKEIESLRAGSPYVLTGSPSGYYYYVDIYKKKKDILDKVDTE